MVLGHEPSVKRLTNGLSVSVRSALESEYSSYYIHRTNTLILTRIFSAALRQGLS